MGVIPSLASDDPSGRSDSQARTRNSEIAIQVIKSGVGEGVTFGISFIVQFFRFVGGDRTNGIGDPLSFR